MRKEPASPSKAGSPSSWTAASRSSTLATPAECTGWDSIRSASHRFAADFNRSVCRRFSFQTRINRRHLQIPDLVGIFADSAIAREPPGAGDVADCLRVPARPICITPIELAVRTSIVGKIREVAIVIPSLEQCMPNRIEYGFLALCEPLRDEQGEGIPSLNLVRVVPMRVIPGSTVGHLLRRQSK